MAHQAGHYPQFLEQKQLEWFCPPLDGMLVHRRVTQSIKFAGTLLYTWVEKDIVKVKPLAQAHNTLSLARVQWECLLICKALWLNLKWFNVMKMFYNLWASTVVLNPAAKDEWTETLQNKGRKVNDKVIGAMTMVCIVIQDYCLKTTYLTFTMAKQLSSIYCLEFTQIYQRTSLFSHLIRIVQCEHYPTC